MGQPVVIKGTKSGIIVVLDPKIEYEELKQALCDKFNESKDFLGSTQVALCFEGRDLNEKEELELTDLISKNSFLDVVCVVDNDMEREKYLQQSLNDKLIQLNSNTGQFFKGNLRSGQVLEFETSVVILGDVNVGAQIVSTGNVVILGSLSGNVYAGAAGNQDAFVAALHMNPKQIRINDIIARAPDKPEQNEDVAKIAYIEEGNIYIEPLNRETLTDIRL